MSEDLLYQIALTMVPHIGPVYARNAIEHFGTAKAAFHATSSRLVMVNGLGESRARRIRRFTDFSRAETELHFAQQNNIRILSFLDADYPRRLLNCYDAPVILYYKGKASLNTERTISIVGTRNPSAYGKESTEKIIDALVSWQATIISGLAYGIDAIAHRKALASALPTIGVLAHGLDTIYPDAHQALAHEMCTGIGGLLTEFPSGTDPDRHNFPCRNRIVAGLSDACVVIETGIKGGSMITASLANGYHRDVLAVPGRVTDARSEGCLQLIRDHRASVIARPADIPDMLNWIADKTTRTGIQRTLFPELDPSEQNVVSCLENHGTLPVDELQFRCGLSASMLAGALLSLELKGVIVSLPGKLYRLS